MQSVKQCDQIFQLGEIHAMTCDDPDITQLVLIQPDLYNVQPGLVKSDLVTSLQDTKGIVFGGLTGDIWWSHNPIEDDPLNVVTSFLTVWEAIHVQNLDELGFSAYLPRLSDPAVGADADVDLLWKRVSRFPIWGIGNDCSGCQLSLQGQGNPDHIRIKSKRRLNEKQSLVYSVAFTGDPGIANAIGGWKMRLNMWLRLAVHAWR